MVPESVPELPLVIVSQVSAGSTSAVHGIVPLPVLTTFNIVEPLLAETLRKFGVTDKIGKIPVPVRETLASLNGGSASAIKAAFFVPVDVGINLTYIVFVWSCVKEKAPSPLVISNWSASVPVK